MDHWLDIPKDRKRQPIGRLCVIMGLTVLLLLAIGGQKESNRTKHTADLLDPA